MNKDLYELGLKWVVENLQNEKPVKNLESIKITITKGEKVRAVK